MRQMTNKALNTAHVKHRRVVCHDRNLNGELRAKKAANGDASSAVTETKRRAVIRRIFQRSKVARSFSEQGIRIEESTFYD